MRSLRRRCSTCSPILHFETEGSRVFNNSSSFAISAREESWLAIFCDDLCSERMRLVAGISDSDEEGCSIFSCTINEFLILTGGCPGRNRGETLSEEGDGVMTRGAVRGLNRVPDAGETALTASHILARTVVRR